MGPCGGQPFTMWGHVEWTGSVRLKAMHSTGPTEVAEYLNLRLSFWDTGLRNRETALVGGVRSMAKTRWSGAVCRLESMRRHGCPKYSSTAFWAAAARLPRWWLCWLLARPWLYPHR